MNHVAGIVGGFNSQEKVVGQEGRIFNLIPKEKQQEAVKFLMENAFTTPTWMIDEEILRRIEPVGVIDRIHTAQTSVLTQSAEQRPLRAAWWNRRRWMAISPTRRSSSWPPSARASGRNWIRRR